MYKFLLLVFLILIPLTSAFSLEIIREQPEPQKEASLSKHQFFITTGFGFRTAKTAENINGTLAGHINGLKRGFNIHAGYAFFVSPTIGPSLKYTHFFASNTTQNLSTDIGILFVGAGISTRSFFDSKTLVNAGLHIGYVAYRQLDTVEGLSVRSTGKTVGLDGSVIFNILVSKKVSLQFEAGYQLASLGNLRMLPAI